MTHLTNQANVENICKFVAATIKDKNTDYGGAYAEAVERFGNQYAVGKIFEKYTRILTLSLNKDYHKVKAEGLRDALLDCMGYCALYIDQLDQQRKEFDL